MGRTYRLASLIIISPVYQKEHDFQVNSDYSTKNHQFSARFLFNHEFFSNPVNSTQAQFNQALGVDNRKIALGDAWSLSSHRGERSASLLIRSITRIFKILAAHCPPDVTIWELGPVTVGPGDNQFSKQNTYQVIDALSWVKGQDTPLSSADSMRTSSRRNIFFRAAMGTTGISPPNSSSMIWSPMTLDEPCAMRAPEVFSELRVLFCRLFAQDDFKITPRLTINLGLRYEFWTNPLGASTQALNAISDVPGVISFQKSRGGQKQHRSTCRIRLGPVGRPVKPRCAEDSAFLMT